MKALETPKELATRIGWPLARVYRLINERRIEYVRVGSRKHIPAGAFERFIVDNKEEPCQEETLAPGSSGLKNVAASTSYGPKVDAAASARLAQQIAQSLKSRSRNFCGVGEAKGPQSLRKR
jgi:excisionase family DNA binding protein